MQLITAYFFIYCKLELVKQVIKEISKLSQVEEVRGTYDVDYVSDKKARIFVKLRADTIEKVNTTNVSIRGIYGITSTLTLVSRPEQGGRDQEREEENLTGIGSY